MRYRTAINNTAHDKWDAAASSGTTKPSELSRRGFIQAVLVAGSGALVSVAACGGDETSGETVGSEAGAGTDAGAGGLGPDGGRAGSSGASGRGGSGGRAGSGAAGHGGTTGAQGSLYITVTNAGVTASVYVDGTYSGTTPLTVDALPVGQHSVRYVAALYDEKTVNATVVANTKVNVETTLVLTPVDVPEYGAGTTLLGAPIGGGSGYANYTGSHKNGSTVHIYTESMMRPQDHICTTTAEFLAALEAAESGDVIFIPSDVTIVLTNYDYNLACKSGVTIASDRGNGSSQGGAIYRQRDWDAPYSESRQELFEMSSTNVRWTGLRIYSDDDKKDFCYDISSPDCAGYPPGGAEKEIFGGISLRGDHCEVDNCELYAWSYHAIAFRGGRDGHVHHCSIHHCHARGYGYGLSVYEGGQHLTEGCIFDYTRHALASSGGSADDYEARYNIHRNHGDAIGGHHFDVHADPLGTGNAGGSTYLHHNTFEVGDGVLEAFGIRACPYQICEIHHNDIMSGDCGFDRCGDGTNIRIWANRVAGVVTDDYILYHA
jgi:hypothetical protein